MSGGDGAGAMAGEGGAEARAGAGQPAAVELDPRVEEVMQQLRSGVRQRQAETAAMGGMAGGSAGGFARALLAIRESEYVEEPVPFSHRPRYGKLIVRTRKAFFSFFLKWFVRPVMNQQNVFNQAAGRMLQELAEAEERTAREVRLLAARLAELETRPAAQPPDPPDPPMPGAGGPSREEPGPGGGAAGGLSPEPGAGGAKGGPRQ